MGCPLPASVVESTESMRKRAALSRSTRRSVTCEVSIGIRRQVSTPGARRESGSARADADFVQVRQQAGRVVVNAIGAGAFQLVLPVAAGEKAHAEGAGAARRPAGPRCCRPPPRNRGWIRPVASAAARNRSGSGLACATWSRVTTGTRADAQHVERRAGAFETAAGGDGVRDV